MLVVHLQLQNYYVVTCGLLSLLYLPPPHCLTYFLFRCGVKTYSSNSEPLWHVYMLKYRVGDRWMDGCIKPKKKSFKCRATELTATPYLFNLKAMTDCCLNETCCIVSPSSFFFFLKIWLLTMKSILDTGSNGNTVINALCLLFVWWLSRVGK